MRSFLFWGFMCVAPCTARGFFRGIAPTRLLYIRGGGGGVYGAWSGDIKMEYQILCRCFVLGP